ncbi:MAG: phenylalanine--tRNA ligase subunit alpha [Candidatus Fermentibacteraceae bacterium]|nr:phenylalanine--tRNA ligase subunit alpha [Candidatus Fermentibacteraceae bacterium]MBN2608730.1 phenylalanine--tRNA ligase subunit alpha [Candidatus Fermentibacteraceae bacterium]
MTADRDLHPLEKTLLAYLEEHGASTDREIIENSELPEEGSYRRAVEWLLSRGLVIEVSREEQESVQLGPLGISSLKVGVTPELAILRRLAHGAGTLQEIQEDATFDRGRWGSGFGALLRSGLVRKDGDLVHLEADAEDNPYGKLWDQVYRVLEDGGEIDLGSLSDEIAAIVRERSPKRGRDRAEFVVVTLITRTVAVTDEGLEALKRARETVTIGAITPGVLADGEWRNAAFRRYSLDMPPSQIHTGRLHPYRQFLDTVRKRFVALGFTEMRGSLAESEFWNNDALFMPQFHPARDIHDVYYLEEGCSVPPPPSHLEESVAAAHENGGDTGGRGWGYSFSLRQSLQAIMRSQGTALSARTLASDPEIPGKYFGIARCFRYDQVDSTHLPDFFQVEGIVLGEGINLRHLMGLLAMFASEIAGASDYKFLPGYFPFTEPSVEMHIHHPVLGWVEGGGAGLFRPEVRLPLGIDVPVIAWGLGLDRMAMLAMGLDDIRDLVTPDLSRLRTMRVRPDSLLKGGGE